MICSAYILKSFVYLSNAIVNLFAATFNSIVTGTTSVLRADDSAGEVTLATDAVHIHARIVAIASRTIIYIFLLILVIVKRT